MVIGLGWVGGTYGIHANNCAGWEGVLFVLEGYMIGHSVGALGDAVGHSEG